MKMQRLRRWPFGGLSWRLAVSYFLVTLLAALTIEVAFVVAPIVAHGRDPYASRSLLQIMLLRKDAIATYMQETNAPDQLALQSVYLNPLANELRTHVAGDGYGMVVVLDPEQHILASTFVTLLQSDKVQSVTKSGSASGSLPTIANLLATPASQGAIQSALVASHDVRLLSSTDAQGVTTLAVPIQSNSRATLGVLVMLFQGKEVGDPTANNTPASFWQALQQQLQPTVFYFLLLAIIIGTLTGLVVSRNLSRRLRRMTLAAGAWSEGQFAVVVRDPARDELGQLGRDLNRMAEQLQSLLATRQGLAVLEERNRLARELHDSVKQHVFANALLVRAANKLVAREPEKAQAALREAEDLAQQAQTELVALIQALRPATLADKGLVAALQEFTGDWARRMGIAVAVRVQGERMTPLEVEEALFRVVQEALTNVARHSDAHAVEIQLIWQENAVALSIQDDGNGFDVAQVAGKGLGLRNMRERLAALGGTFALTSTARGTFIELRVPLLAEPNDNMAEVIDG